MKIITWNCNMAFRKKAGLILAHQPDIGIIPECEHPDKLQFDTDVPLPSDMTWFGTNVNKGLGIFSYSDFRFNVHRKQDPSLKMIVPLKVSGPAFNFMLYAVWANNPADRGHQYVGQVWKALHHYRHCIRRERTILAGDFNSNTIWDKAYRKGNHSDVVKKLDAKGIHSCYHLHHRQEHGNEAHATHYLYRHAHRPYHLDYCFASSDLSGRISKVEIGDHGFWSKYSDHVPVMVTFSS